MNKHYIVIALFLLCFSMGYSQGKITVRGSKNVSVVSTEVKPFTKIVLDGEYNITLEKGDKPLMTVETDDNIQEFISGKVKEGVLTVNCRAVIRSKRALNITITYVDGLKEIETTGSGQISSLETLDFKDITLRIVGGSRSNLTIRSESFKIIVGENSSVILNIEAPKADIELSENSSIEGVFVTTDVAFNMSSNSSAKIQGETVTLNIQADNSADFQGKDFIAQNTKVVANSRSDIYINSSDLLEIDTAGNSEIYVYSNPKITLHSFLDASVLRKK